MIYITGDTHRDFQKIKFFCKENNTTKKDIIIILGDVGINYFGRIKDWSLKHSLSKLPITLFCVQGNHEQRPFNIETYEEIEMFGAKVYLEKEFDNLIFAKDGEIYDFEGLKCVVIGGAYSTDKYYRIVNNLHWFKDEQPSDKIKKYVEKLLKKEKWKVDYVFTHTCPFNYRPVEAFLPILNQEMVDTSTEKWLQKIEDKLEYQRWFCGHFHIEKLDKKIRFLFDDIIELNKKEKFLELSFIKDVNLRRKTFFDLWEKEVAPYILKEKYEFFHGNDIFLKNFTEKDDEVLNNFFTKYHNLFKYGKLKEEYSEKYSKYKEILVKHIFDF